MGGGDGFSLVGGNVLPGGAEGSALVALILYPWGPTLSPGSSSQQDVSFMASLIQIPREAVSLLCRVPLPSGC